MNTCRQSRAGWILVAAYLIASGILFHEALTCQGWVCDLVALPAVFPIGLAISWLLEGIGYLFVLPELTAGLLRRWHFIIATVLANAIFYFWAGWQLESLLRRFRRCSAAQR